MRCSAQNAVLPACCGWPPNSGEDRSRVPHDVPIPAVSADRQFNSGIIAHCEKVSHQMWSPVGIILGPNMSEFPGHGDSCWPIFAAVPADLHLFGFLHQEPKQVLSSFCRCGLCALSARSTCSSIRSALHPCFFFSSPLKVEQVVRPLLLLLQLVQVAEGQVPGPQAQALELVACSPSAEVPALVVVGLLHVLR